MNYKVKSNNNIIEFTLNKTKRKSICIKIDGSGKIIVSAPVRCNNNIIFDFVKSKSDWILEKQIEILKINDRKIKREIKDGSTLMYLGNEYPIKILYDSLFKKIKINLKDDIFIIESNSVDSEKVKKEIEKWYRARTLEVVTSLIEKNSYRFIPKVNNIKVKEQKRRYASCTYKNDILFNWRCSMARIDVIEYIVIHEMCHFIHKNHSKDFWNSVREIMPDYKEKHKYLKDNNINFYI